MFQQKLTRWDDLSHDSASSDSRKSPMTDPVSRHSAPWPNTQIMFDFNNFSIEIRVSNQLTIIPLDSVNI